MQYNHKDIESKWQKIWELNNIFKTSNNFDKPKFYILNMFPYPSGSGLHVGHPLGYITSDVFYRYKKLKGYNVLHPMGFDSFGLPAEQYAIETGQHPANTTHINIEGGKDLNGNKILGYKNQLKKLGLAYDWSREINTSSPNYYKWTQYLFIKLFNSFYNKKKNKASNIEELIEEFNKYGNMRKIAYTNKNVDNFSKDEWIEFSKEKQYSILLDYRLAYIDYVQVNWCPDLGTVLANDEIINGLSERGGYKVYKKKMKQWMIRISAYCERLILDLKTICWPDSIKETQKKWIGEIEGFNIKLNIYNNIDVLNVFTKNPECIFGTSFIAISSANKILKNNDFDSNKEIFTKLYAIHPYTLQKIPIWISDNLTEEYNEDAILGIPDLYEDHKKFALKYNIKINNVIENSIYGTVLINSAFLTNMKATEAKIYIENDLKIKKIGNYKKIYKLRDAIFSRQRYWGEPIPIYYKNNLPYTIPEECLPLILPNINEYKPTEDGSPPLGRSNKWAFNTITNSIVETKSVDNKEIFPIELNTMPGWAGSSWYWIRYMDPLNNIEIANKKYINYWKQVDLYIGGAEHATGHLIYARFFQKFMSDIKITKSNEFANKLINQGMILGKSAIIHRLDENPNKFVSKELKNNYQTTPLHIDINLLESDSEDCNKLNVKKFKNWRKEYLNSKFIMNDVFLIDRQTEKMSKSKYNVINPEEICNKYGADSFRMYELFLGPIEQSKPWNTRGINGVYSFTKKFWGLFFKEDKFSISLKEPTEEEKNILNIGIKKIEKNMSNFSLNTCISEFMIIVNNLSKLKCNKIKILKPLCIILHPFAPHITEELWNKMGEAKSILYAKFPNIDNTIITRNTISYNIYINNKFKSKIDIPSNIKNIDDLVTKYLENNKILYKQDIKKIIIVKNKIVNILTN